MLSSSSARVDLLIAQAEVRQMDHRVYNVTRGRTNLDVVTDVANRVIATWHMRHVGQDPVAFLGDTSDPADQARLIARYHESYVDIDEMPAWLAESELTAAV